MLPTFSGVWLSKRKWLQNSGCRYSAMLVSMAFQESYAFFNHLRLSLLRTPSLFPTDHLPTHKLSPLWSLVDLDSFNYTPSCCHDTDGVHRSTLGSWDFYACFKCTNLGRVKQVGPFLIAFHPVFILGFFFHVTYSPWVFQTRKAGKLRVLKHQSLSILRFKGHRPASVQDRALLHWVHCGWQVGLDSYKVLLLHCHTSELAFLAWHLQLYEDRP